MPRPARKCIVRLRMWYAKARGHTRWDYEPSDNYMGRKCKCKTCKCKVCKCKRKPENLIIKSIKKWLGI